MYLDFWWWILKIGQTDSTFRFPSWDSVSASRIFCSSSSNVGSISSQPSGGFFRDLLTLGILFQVVLKYVSVQLFLRAALEPVEMELLKKAAKLNANNIFLLICLFVIVGVSLQFCGSKSCQKSIELCH